MAPPTRPDPPLLFVGPTKKPWEPPPPETELKYALFYRTIDENGFIAYQQVNLCGFSYFQELNGLGDDPGMDLWSENDPEVAAYMEEHPGEFPPPITEGGTYGMMFDDYLDQLQAKKINYSRLFVFPLGNYQYEPYDKNDAGKFILPAVSPDYLDRLVEFIEKARRRGIIVCISLFSSQTLDKDYWKNYHPFNVDLNTTKAADPAKKGYIADEEGNAFPRGFEYFCSVADGSPASEAQKNLVTEIVTRSRPYWNVMYEIFNEPAKDVIPILNAAPWIKRVAGWIDALLQDGTDKRTRLIAITSIDDLVTDLMTKLLPPGGQPLVDVFSFHGTQWGGRAGSGRPDSRFFVCKEDREILLEPIIVGETELTNLGEVYRPGINDAIKRFHFQSNYPVGLIFDSDSLYWAQKEPELYVQACLERGLSFSYRWSDTFINFITDGFCNSQPNLGLEQRLGKIEKGQKAAETDDEPIVTKFPTPPANVKKDLTVTVDGAYLTMTFSRPDPAPGEDTTPEGYVAYFGTSPETVGNGAPPFPSRRYFKVADPQHPQFVLAFQPTSQPSEVFVAVAARNGILAGEWSNIVRVPIASAAEIFNAEVNFDPAKTSLPVGEIPARDMNLRVTFKNTGAGSWRSVRNGIRDSSNYLISQALYLVAPAPKRPAVPVLVVDLPNDVPPGGEVTFDLSALAPKPFFPYSRQPINYNFVMVTVVDFSPGGKNNYPFGPHYDKLPDGTPLQVHVTNQDQSQPKRRATQLFKKALTIQPGQADVQILSNADAHTYEFISLTCGDPGPEGAVIRADVTLEPDTAHLNRLHRVVRISHTAPVPLTIDAWIVAVDKLDIQYEARVLDYIAVFKDKPPLSINLGALEYKFEIASLYSRRTLKQGAVEYYPFFRSTGSTRKRLHVGIEGASADSEPYVQCEMRVVEVLENLGPLEFDQRKRDGQIVVFNPGDGLTKYAKIGDGSTHNFQVVSLASIDDVPIRWSIVLRANAAGVFERALEVTRDDTTVDGRIPNFILDVPLEVTVPAVRQATNITSEHEGRILEFFNNAATAHDISYGICDNPSFGRRTRRAFSIRSKLAQRILDTRNSLPERRFTSLGQIDAIRGVGKDTLEDIAYTFEDDKSDDGGASSSATGAPSPEAQ